MTKVELLSRFDILRTEYVKLLNDQDVLLNWGKPQLTALYSTKICVYQVEELQLTIRVKALKRKIEIVRSLIVNNQPISEDAIDAVIAGELADFEMKLMQEVAQVEAAKLLLANLDTPQRSAELRTIFRQLAKQLHPDINPELTQGQIELWHKVKAAYNSGDMERLKALQVAYEKELQGTDDLIQKLTEEQLELRNNVLAEGIKVLAKDIEQIREDFPFNIEQQIKDDEWVKERTDEIQKNISALRVYEGELILEFEALINGYGGTKPELN